jgi:ferredoxin/flavodoxin---NADP+ reductase
VIHAVGASNSRDLGIPGEDLPGSHAAADFVGWYNGHPDHAHHAFDLSTERAVIVGNGNVALASVDILPLDAAAAFLGTVTGYSRHGWDVVYVDLKPPRPC